MTSISDAFRDITFGDGISKALNSMVQQMQDGGRLLRDAKTGAERDRRYRKADRHRETLILAGKYIRTSERSREGRRKSRIAPVEWFVRKPTRLYPPPHHRGSAADVEHHWPGCGHE